jgi:hypothetical protein
LGGSIALEECIILLDNSEHIRQQCCLDVCEEFSGGAREGKLGMLVLEVSDECPQVVHYA